MALDYFHYKILLAVCHFLSMYIYVIKNELTYWCNAFLVIPIARGESQEDTRLTELRRQRLKGREFESAERCRAGLW